MKAAQTMKPRFLRIARPRVLRYDALVLWFCYNSGQVHSYGCLFFLFFCVSFANGFLAVECGIYFGTVDLEMDEGLKRGIGGGD